MIARVLDDQLSTLAAGLLSALAMAALLAPLWVPGYGVGVLGGWGAGMVVIALCGAALVAEASDGLGPKAVAVLGALVATNAALRLAETIVQGPGGFSPIFALIVLSGYACGMRFGFLCGALSLVVSALVTGGVGPWLPYQAVVAGWVGATAGLLPGAGRRGGSASAQPSMISRRMVAGLAAFGGLWGFGYGLLLTLWGWGYFESGAAMAVEAVAVEAVAGEAAVASTAGLSIVRRYAIFYLATSLGWDAFRALGNVVLILAIGRPVLLALRRMRWWFGVSDASGTPPAAASPAAGAMYQDLGAREATVDLRWSNLQADEGVAVEAWVVWVAGVMILVSVTRNWIVLGLAAVAVVVVAWRHCNGQQSGDDSRLPIVRLGVAIVVLAGGYYTLLVRGGETILGRLPSAWPLNGAALTAESLVWGVASGMGLVVLIGAFIVFQAVVPVRELIRLAPPALGEAAVVVAIGLNWVPAMGQRWGEAAEARELRGLGGRGPRAWLALATPVVLGAVERAASLAEALAARGLVRPGATPVWPRVAVSVGTFAVAVALMAMQSTVWRVLLVIAGAGALWWGSTHATRGHRRTRLRPRNVGPAEFAVAAGAVAPLLVALASPDVREALRWSPYPRLDLPPAGPALVLATAALALPALVRGGRARVELADLQAPLRRSVPARPAPTPRLPADERGASVTWRDFTFVYPETTAPALNNITAVVPRGGLWWVAGQSGVGKSTLLRTVNGLVPRFSGGHVSGYLDVLGRDPVRLGTEGMSDAVGWLASEPEAAIVTDRVADEVAFGLEQRGMEPLLMRATVYSLLEALGLYDLADRGLRTLSGGEMQRVALAAALASGAEMLVLDEPTAWLDDDAAEQVLKVVTRLAEAGTTVLVASHDARRLGDLADGMLWLDGAGGLSRLLPAEAAERITRLTVVPAAPPGLPADAPAVLQTRGLRFGYSADVPLLDKVDLELRRGEVVVLAGASGAGKTTLLRLLLGLVKPWSGEMSIAGQNVPPTDSKPGSMGYVPQNAGTMLLSETVIDELRLSRHGRRLNLDDAADMVLLQRLGVEHLARRYPRALSTGERQRVAIAAAVAAGPAVLMLDEPTRGLDAAAVGAFARLVHGLAADGAAILIASHDRRLWPAAHRVMSLSEAILLPLDITVATRGG